MKVVKDRDIVKKLFEDIAPRFKDRKGGYTRIYLLGKRPGDAAEMSIVELVERKIVEKKTPKDKDKEAKKEKKAKKEEESKAEKKERKRKKSQRKTKTKKERR